ncbi:MAG: intradiol ring-cleavage dioxygenase [Alphaproteobacteria bacterium]|nr:intradiol ring-cleavage dioxygenase [Alphaproteobacteria bacterium]
MEDHDKGLVFDLERMATPRRREVLGWLGVAACLPLIGCGDDEKAGESAETGGAGGDSGWNSDSCAVIPEETEGPYPGDGTNGPDALALDDIVRSDIRSSIGDLSGTAAGVPLTIRLRVVDVNNGCAPLAGYAIYLWHCDRDGNYSLYSITDQNYLRGVQVTDDDGVLSFTSIFPGCYSGRWPHIHFEVFSSLAEASNGRNNVKTSQIALPEDACEAVYATSGYEDSVRNLQQITLDSDNVFSDGVEDQMPTISGSASEGYTIRLTVGIEA